MTIWTDPVDGRPAGADEVSANRVEDGQVEVPVPSEISEPARQKQVSETPVFAPRYNEYGWPIPSSLSSDPEEARSRILRNPRQHRTISMSALAGEATVRRSDRGGCT